MSELLSNKSPALLTSFICLFLLDMLPLSFSLVTYTDAITVCSHDLQPPELLSVHNGATLSQLWTHLVTLSRLHILLALGRGSGVPCLLFCWKDMHKGLLQSLLLFIVLSELVLLKSLPAFCDSKNSTIIWQMKTRVHPFQMFLLLHPSSALSDHIAFIVLLPQTNIPTVRAADMPSHVYCLRLAEMRMSVCLTLELSSLHLSHH